MTILCLERFSNWSLTVTIMSKNLNVDMLNLSELANDSRAVRQISTFASVTSFSSRQLRKNTLFGMGGVYDYSLN